MQGPGSLKGPDLRVEGSAWPEARSSHPGSLAAWSLCRACLPLYEWEVVFIVIPGLGC